MAPRTVALAQNIGTGATTAALTSAAAQQATTGTINPQQVMNEAVAGGILTAPTATVSALTTPRAPAQLTQPQLVAERAIAQGATLPPTQVNPSMLNRLLEGFSGKRPARSPILLHHSCTLHPDYLSILPQHHALGRGQHIAVYCRR